MKKKTCAALAAVMTMTASINVLADYDKNYLDITGRSVGQVADSQGYEFDEFKAMVGLPDEIPSTESEAVAQNNLPAEVYAQMVGTNFQMMKEAYGWGDEITPQTPIGIAIDVTPLSKYIGMDSLEEFKTEYGLGEEVTGDTLWGQVRLDVEKIEQSKLVGTFFNDVGYAHWAYDYISDMSKGGIIEGYDDGTYAPEKTITRAEFAKILCGVAEKSGIVQEGATAEFTDVVSDEWYYDYVNKIGSYMSAQDISGEYRPNEIAKREDVAVALVKLMGYQVSENDLTKVFTDASEISENNKKYVGAAVENGLLDGFEDDTFRGNEGITRAQAAAVIGRAVDNTALNPLMEKTAIKAGDFVITAGDIAYLASSMIYSGYSPEQSINYVTQDLVKTFEYGMVARETGLGFSDEDKNVVVNTRAQVAAQSGGLKAFKKALKKNGSDIKFIETLIAEQRYVSLLETIMGAAIDGENVSDKQLKEKFIDSYYRAKHILVDEESGEGILKGKSFAENLLDRAKSGEDFDAMTEKYTKDPGSAANPDGYIFTDGEMVTEFEDCVKSLDVNKFGMCESDYGYHIIKRLPLDEKQKDFEKWFEASKGAIAEKVAADVMNTSIETMCAQYQIAADIDEDVIKQLIESF